MTGFGEVARKMLLGFGSAVDETSMVAVSELVRSSHCTWVSLSSLGAFVMTGETGLLETLKLAESYIAPTTHCLL